MEHSKILKKSWKNLWGYKALWIFGILLAMTTASWGSASFFRGGGSGGNVDPDPQFDFNFPEDLSPSLQEELEEASRALEYLFEEQISPDILTTIITVGIILACLIVLLYIAGRIVRYVSETALIKMVDTAEETGEQSTIRQGFRYGWSRTAWQLFLIELVINIPVFIGFVLIVSVFLLPLPFLIGMNVATRVGGVIAGIGLLFLMVLLVIIVSALLLLLKHFARRACALEGLGVVPSIRRGFEVIRRNLKDVGLMWLIIIGIYLGWPIVAIPAAILAVVVALILAGIPVLLVGGIGSLFAEVTTSWILAGVVGLPIFILVVAVPMAFLDGLRETFVSSTWTLTYRELLAQEQLGELELPEVTPTEDIPPQEEYQASD